MNILWLTWKDRRNPLAGGAEVVNEELARRLVAEGHRVTFVTSGFAGAPDQEMRHGFRIIRVGSRYTTYLAAWRYIRRHRQRLAPDLVIDECNTMPYFAAWYAGVPTVLFVHMLCRRIWFYEFPQPLSTLGWLAEPLYLRLLKRGPVITVSESTRQDLVRHGFRPGDIQIISEGIQLAPVASLDKVLKAGRPTLLSFGAMRAMKRTLDQIRAFELARAKVPGLRLVIAGDSSGVYGRRVMRAILRSPYAADIEYMGRVSEAEKIQLMQQAHLILVTSVKEGWGLIVTEAASQGTPAVVYNVGGLRDSVRQAQTGIVTTLNTPAELAAGAVKLLRDPDQYRRLQTQAWEWSRTITFDRAYHQFRDFIGQAVQTHEGDALKQLEGPDKEAASL
jgi:glycosyltransferase involved in cell wall biosynthesis